MRVEGEKRAKGTHKSDFCCSFAMTYCLVGLIRRRLWPMVRSQYCLGGYGRSLLPTSTLGLTLERRSLI